MSAIYDIDGNEILIEQEVQTRTIDISGIPCLHLLGTLPASKNDGNVKVPFVFSNGTERFNGFCTLKVQGNSTTAYPKKNFTFKTFTDKACKNKMNIAFNDWGEQNKFVLKADWIDISHARNIVSARLWSDVVASRSSYDDLPELYKSSPNNCVVDGFIIKVYANGVYWGRYSFNIPKDPWMFNMDDSLDTHAVLCSEDYSSSCFRATAKLDGTDWTDEMHEDNPPQSIKTRWNQVISFVQTSSDEDFVANINNYIDLESLIDYYIFAYVDCGLDALGKNQIYLTYDGIHFYASMYDMDSTWGLYWNGLRFVPATYRMQEDYEVGVNNTSNLLYDRIEALFVDQIKARYQSLRNGILSAAYIKEKFKEWCDISSAELVAEDYAITTGNGAFIDMPQKTTNNYEQLATFIDDRLDYVDSQLRQCNVYFVKSASDGGGILQTIQNVNYGTIITAASSYIESTPTTTRGNASDYPFDGWIPSEAVIRGDTTFIAKFGGIEIIEITDSWDTIIDNIENNTYLTEYKIGNYKSLDLGPTYGTVNMQIMAMDEDILENNNTVPITFVSMGGIANSTMAWDDVDGFLNNTIYSLIENNVKSHIQTVSKYTVQGNSKRTQSMSKLWMLSAREVNSSYFWKEDMGVTYNKMFSTDITRKASNGAWYWLRSEEGGVISANPKHQYVADGDVGVSNNTLNDVRFGFGLGKSS